MGELKNRLAAKTAKTWKAARGRLAWAALFMADRRGKAALALLLIALFHGGLGIMELHAVDPNQVLNDIRGPLQAGIRLVGVGICIFGGVKLAQSFSNDDSDARQKGVMGLGGGAVVIGSAQMLDLLTWTP